MDPLMVEAAGIDYPLSFLWILQLLYSRHYIHLGSTPFFRLSLSKIYVCTWFMWFRVRLSSIRFCCPDRTQCSLLAHAVVDPFYEVVAAVTCSFSLCMSLSPYGLEIYI